MKGLENQIYLVMYIISNIVAIILLLAAWKRPQVSRFLFTILFAWACWVNWNTALHSPQDYLNYADLTFMDSYRKLILGWFSQNIPAVVGFIATCQGLIALSLVLKGWMYKLGLAGGILFLVAIAPFGVGSAFPATVVMAVSLVLLWGQDAFLWQYVKGKYTIAHH